MPSTIRDLTELTVVAVDDYLLISDTSDVTNRDKRISRANLFANYTLKTGTPVAGRVAMWTDANTIQASGIAVTDVALLNVAQTYTAAATFSSLITANAGINFGGTTLNQYAQGTWTPTDASGAALTLSTAVGRYTRIGRMVFLAFAFTYPTTSDTSNHAISGLPFTPLSITGTTAGGVMVGVTTLTFPVIGFINTTPLLLLSNASTGAALKNSDLSGKYVRGWAMHDI